jgi:hypothetical protein
MQQEDRAKVALEGLTGRPKRLTPVAGIYDSPCLAPLLAPVWSEIGLGC